jgi:methylthioribose-1-phosphate isomerase
MSDTLFGRRSVEFTGDSLVLLDQRLLPHQAVYEPLHTLEEVWEAIRTLKVRGAPAIGIAAAFGLALWARSASSLPLEAFRSELKKKRDYLASSRPTAVNLFWALDRTVRAVEAAASTAEAISLIESEAFAIQREDEETCRRIGEHALSLLHDGARILTICNAGGIATARYGTALAPFYLAREKGWTLSAYACETRPLLQGARLTTWELQQIGVDVTLITDGMAAHVLKTKNITAVLVGCDRVAANGDTANKIGTFALALQAHTLGIPFYVCAPLSTVDLDTPDGESIPIEERAADEVIRFAGQPVAPEGTSVFNPAFDVTPHRYITGIVTEKGIVRGNYKEELARLKQA